MTEEAKGAGEVSANAGRKAWAMPTVTELATGEAEAVPGTAASDFVLETVGS